jgi:hypothetical protein
LGAAISTWTSQAWRFNISRRPRLSANSCRRLPRIPRKSQTKKINQTLPIHLTVISHKKKISLEENTPSNINFHEIYRQNAASKLPMIIYNIALSFYRKENYTEAIRYFLQIGSTQSNNFWYWYRLGVCYYKVYLQKISDKYQSCDNDLYTRSNDFPSPLPNFNASEMKNKARTDSSNSMNYPQPLLPGQEKELGQQKKMDKGPKDGPESDYEFVKENKFKRYHLSGEKSAWSDEDRQILTKNLRNSYK